MCSDLGFVLLTFHCVAWFRVVSHTNRAKKGSTATEADRHHSRRGAGNSTRIQVSTLIYLQATWNDELERKPRATNSTRGTPTFRQRLAQLVVVHSSWMFSRLTRLYGNSVIRSQPQ